MTDTIVILTEEPLKPVDVSKIRGLYDGEDVTYRVLVPADTERNVLVSVLDHLSLFEMKEAFEALKPVDRSEARADAQHALATSVKELTDAGATATGAVTADDPMDQLKTEVTELKAREVVVVTEPHIVEDTFHADWGTFAREELGVPVLHMYAGDWRLG